MVNKCLILHRAARRGKDGSIMLKEGDQLPWICDVANDVAIPLHGDGIDVRPPFSKRAGLL